MAERDAAAEERLRKARENTEALAAHSSRVNGSPEEEATEAAGRAREARLNRDALEAQRRLTEATTPREVRERPIGEEP